MKLNIKVRNNAERKQNNFLFYHHPVEKYTFFLKTFLRKVNKKSLVFQSNTNFLTSLNQKLDITKRKSEHVFLISQS